MYAVVAIILAALACLVAYLLYSFGDIRKLPWYTVVVAFIAWVFPFSLPLILPLDLASTDYRAKCLSGAELPAGIICDEPFAYVDRQFLFTYWKTVYWTMFCLTWFTIPILQSWVRAGDFKFRRRLWAALKDNLIYWSILGGVGLVSLIYILVVAKISQDILLVMGMAAANAWGLLLITVMMGYGLVEVPRTLWYSANTTWSLRYMEYIIPGAKEAALDSEAEIFDIARRIAIASKETPLDSELRYFVDKLIQKCPLALEERNLDRNLDADEIPAEVTEAYLVDLHARIKRAAKLHDRSQAQYRFLCQKAFLYQDIIENYRNKERKFISSRVNVKPDQFADIKLRAYWYWYVWLRPNMFRLLSFIAVFASLAVIWSESTFQVESPTLSVPAAILKSPYVGYFATELVAIGFILYMCVCAYTTLFKIKFMDYYLVAEHHTDEGSLMFVGGYLCKLTFPLCYNFINIAKDNSNDFETAFIEYQGKAASLTPLLGDSYNKWLPEIVLVFAFITFFNLHGRLLRLFKVKYYSYHEAMALADSDLDEGRQIIDQARSVDERKRGGLYGSEGNFANNDGPALSSIERTNHRTTRSTTGGRAKNAKELLEKYKTGNRKLGAGGPEEAGSLPSKGGPVAGSTASISSNKPGGGWASGWKQAATGYFSGKKSGGADAGKFQRLDQSDVESGSMTSLNDISEPAASSRTGRQFGIAPKQETGGWFSNSLSAAGKDASSDAPAAPKPHPSSTSKAGGRTQPKNMFDDI
ncbi:LMBR1-like membrane protein-domain-containing protein [Fimicolochytrium jonesii]|uniref:LMBR1-like membrane protein-domain-containing protein n=1 Tax=Fimicolochytrium jonesii TaxID=1396493 RepID=UPI0022FE39CF|nr:LMBR1-like membrane protein-domain-containing protein [Fimicolochytrium jonesii]KAI8823560.1 LMBR1-like membrane protein-domain-containing protein [Fimicolochytrium jonesii]